jgi:hypothetical protein
MACIQAATIQMADILQRLTPGDLRLSQRRRLLKDGRIVVRRGWSLIDCTIRDTSTGGARLSVQPVCDLPREFDLLYVAEGKLVPCELRWRRGDRVGVRFTGNFRKAPPYRL